MKYDLEYLLSPECKEHVLQTAIRLYCRRDPFAPTLKDISNTSSVPLAVIRRHYPCPDDLKKDVLDWFFNDKFPKLFFDACDQRILSKQSLSEFDLLMIFFEICELTISRYSCIFHEDLTRIKRGRDKKGRATSFSQLLERFSILFKDLIQKGQESGFFTRQLDCQKMASIFRHLLQGAVAESLLLDESSEPDFFFDRMKSEAQEIICGNNLDFRILSE
jgi:hypothetical protein